MDVSAKIAIVCVLVAGGGIGVYCYRNKKGTGNNFSAVVKNTGLTPNSDNILVVPFNSESKTPFKAQFYTNDRVVIFENNKVIKKGKYMDGGKKILMDNGIVLTNGSVFGNLLSSIK